MSAAPRAQPQAGTLARMALCGAGVLLLEVLLTRLLSVVLFAYLAFGAVAIALLGTAIGSALAAHHARRRGESIDCRVALALTMAGAAALLAFWCAASVQIFPDTMHLGGTAVDGFLNRRHAFEAGPAQLRWFPFAVVVLLQMVPFSAAGYVQGLWFAGTSISPGRLYAADVAGATAGALLSLLILPRCGAVDGVGAVMLCFGAAAILGAPAGLRAPAAAVLAAGLAILVLRPLEIRRAAGYAEAQVVATDWSSLARVSLWDAGHERVRAEALQQPWLLVDNTSLSLVAFRGDRRFDDNVERVPFALRPEGEVLILGAGGGQEIETALATSPGRRRRVDAVEVAGGELRLLQRYFSTRPDYLLQAPNVSYQIADGRWFVEMSERRWSVIEMKEVNFHSLAGQVSAAWSPSLLFTREAFRADLEHLTADGLLAINHGNYFGQGEEVTLHLVSTLRAAAEQLGLELASRLVIVDRPFSGGGSQRMFLVARAPFTAGELDAIDRQAAAQHLVIARSPRQPYRGADLEAIIAAAYAPTIARLFRERHVLLDATVDDRPFGHHHLGYVQAILGAPAAAHATSDLALQSADFRLLSAVLLALALLIAAAVGLFIRRTARPARGLAVRQLAVFALLGVGFMLFEIVTMERTSLLLGHPTLGFVVVLVALLLALFAGSWLSDRARLDRRRWLACGVAAGAVLAVCAVPSALPVLMPWVRRLPPGARPWLVGGAMFLVSTPLGALLPTTIRLLGATGAATPAAGWATNCLTSVLGTLAAALLVRTVGFNATIGGATLAYAIACVLWLALVYRTQKGAT